MSRRHRTSRAIGELLLTSGILVLLYLVYLLWVTDIHAARKQQHATDELHQSWATAPNGADGSDEVTGKPRSGQRPERGEPFSRLYVPRFGEDYAYTVLEGLSRTVLSTGVGHYPRSDMPGETGNFAVAGHRLGNGGPFRDLDELESCDAVVVETADEFLVYRVLPLAGDTGDRSSGRSGTNGCADSSALQGNEHGAYREVVGRRIVAPERVDAVAPVPYQEGRTLSPEERHPLLTLTTCHPEYGDSERMIVHAALTERKSKTTVDSYAELLSRIRESS